MKLNYVKFASIVLLGVGVGVISCKKSFLETTPKGEFLESNYYQTPDQAFSGLVAAYDPLVTETGGSDQTYTNPLGPLNSASDDCYAGGGGSSDTPDWQVWNNYTLNSAQGPQAGFWTINFLGVSRANTILANLASVPGLSTALAARYTGEAQFLRAHYYFDLVRLFKNVPLITAPLDPSSIYNQPQAAPSAVYAQIEADLNAAIPNLPAVLSSSESGRVSQGAAIALLGKVLLYEQKWAAAAAQFAKINGTTPGGTSATYNYALQKNFQAIFSPNNKFNSEAIFEIPHTATQNYNWGQWDSFKGNVYVQMVGPRDFGDAFYAGGWGFNPVTQQLHDFMKGDPRYGYTLYNMDSLSTLEHKTYTPSYQNTGYFLLKYAPLTQFKSTNGTVELNYPNDYIEIRLADTYLMEAEALINANGDLVRAAALLNAVRARVGLAPVAATLTNVYNERRMELATEGHRWFDLVRWGQAPAALAFKGFVAGKNEILPIPLNELSNTKLVQNPGYK
jgi:hypothetical protein